jgi:hypothetical protein
MAKIKKATRRPTQACVGCGNQVFEREEPTSPRHKKDCPFVKEEEASRLIFKEAFEGKTIKRVDTRAVNVVVFHFTDGTKGELEVEALGGGLYGIVQNK